MAAERKLKIVVSAKNDTRKGFNAVKSAAKRMRAAVSRGAALAAKAMKAAFAAAAAAVVAAVALMARTVKQQFAEIDKLAKDSLRFGIAIENMRGLQLAAKLSGNSVAQLRTIMRDLSRRTSEAAQGTGEAVDAIKELGLNAAELNKQSPDKQLETVLRALRKVENHNDRIRIAYDVMGRSGTEALTLLNHSLQETRLEAELLTGAITPELAQDIQDANDEVERMRSAWKGIAQTIAGEVAPLIENLSKSIKQQLITIRFSFEAAFKSGALLWDEMLTTWKLRFVSFSRDILNSRVGQFLFGEGAGDGMIGRLEVGIRARLESIRAELDGLAGFEPNLGGDDDVGRTAAERARAERRLPGITSGRLITGGAAAGADEIRRLARQRNEDARRQAAEAKAQRQELYDLLRQAIQNPRRGSLGGLLQSN